jgi:hypothetical protein
LTRSSRSISRALAIFTSESRDVQSEGEER